MKVVIELKLTGDFAEGLDDDSIEEMIDKVIEYGSESCCLTGRYVIREVLER